MRQLPRQTLAPRQHERVNTLLVSGKGTDDGQSDDGGQGFHLLNMFYSEQ